MASALLTCRLYSSYKKPFCRWSKLGPRVSHGNKLSSADDRHKQFMMYVELRSLFYRLLVLKPIVYNGKDLTFIDRLEKKADISGFSVPSVP